MGHHGLPHSLDVDLQTTKFLYPLNCYVVSRADTVHYTQWCRILKYESNDGGRDNMNDNGVTCSYRHHVSRGRKL